MKPRGPLVALLLLATTMPGAASAQGMQDMIASIALPPGACPAAEARDVDLRALLADPDAHRGDCIRVSGIVVGWTLYPDAKTAWRQPETIPASERLGAYGDKALLGKLPVFPSPATLVGRMSGRCEDRAFIGGYCHYAGDGSFMILSEVTVGPPMTRAP